MTTIKPTISERVQGSAIAAAGSTLVMVLIKVYEYHEHPHASIWMYLLLHLRLWFLVVVPILAIFGATVVANRIADARGGKK